MTKIVLEESSSPNSDLQKIYNYSAQAHSFIPNDLLLFIK